VRLPTYPFARERYWLVEERAEVGPLKYREVWEEREAGIGEVERSWEVVYFAKDEAEERALGGSAEWSSARDRLRVVRRGAQVREELKKIARGSRAVVVYRWSEGEKAEGLRGLFELLQAIKEAGTRVARLLLTGSRGAGSGSCYDESWIGFERSLGLVLPELELRLVYGKAEELTPERLWQELWRERSGVVRYERGKREELSIRRVEKEGSGRGVSLRRGGVYLITGGYGGLGLMFARELAREYGAKLILTGRRALDGEVEQALTELRQAGAQAAKYYAVDVRDRAKTRELMREVKREFGGVNGGVG
jgi:hypothetical protein